MIDTPFYDRKVNRPAAIGRWMSGLTDELSDRNILANGWYAPSCIHRRHSSESAAISPLVPHISAPV